MFFHYSGGRHDFAGSLAGYNVDMIRVEQVLDSWQTIRQDRSQLFVYLRLKGMVPATTRRRLAKQAAK